MLGNVVVQDESQMLDKIHQLPIQFEKAWTSIWIKDLDLSQKINRVLVVGMGGSGIAGYLASELAELKVPLVPWSNYELPIAVDESTLVVALSYSGETEETIHLVRMAAEKKLPLICLTTGGKLEELSKIHNFPCFKIDYASQPRAALGWLYGGLLTVLTKLKLTSLTEERYFQAVRELENVVKSKIMNDKAEQLAVSLNNKIPLIFAAPPLLSVARRFVTQINENSKSIALYAPLPESCHNLIVGLENPVPEKINGIILQSRYGFSRDLTRIKILEQVLGKRSIEVTPLTVKSGSQLAEQILFLYFADLLSYYLAGVYGVDPTPIEIINELKEGLKKA